MHSGVGEEWARGSMGRWREPADCRGFLRKRPYPFANMGNDDSGWKLWRDWGRGDGETRKKKIRG